MKQDIIDLINELDDNEFWEYVRSWLSIDFIMSIIENWDNETKKQEIKKIKNILKKREMI